MKKKMIVFYMILALFLFMGNAKAEEEEDLCSSVQLSELRSEAANVKVTYVTGEEIETTNEPDPEIGVNKLRKHYVYIKIFNINSRMAVRVTPSGSGVSANQMVVDSSMVDLDGVITLRQPASDVNVNYQFNVYSLYGGCSGRTLRTMKLTVPKFNIYSELDICSDVPDFYLCLQYTNYNIDSATVYNRIEDYKARLSTQNVDEENSDGKNNTLSKTMTSISKYKYIIVGVIVAIGVVITVILIRRKKSVL